MKQIETVADMTRRTCHSRHLLADHVSSAQALTSGFQRALFIGSIFLIAAAVIGLRATNTRGETDRATAESESADSPAPAAAA
jgi:hypothetical protein